MLVACVGLSVAVAPAMAQSDDGDDPDSNDDDNNGVASPGDISGDFFCPSTYSGDSRGVPSFIQIMSFAVTLIYVAGPVLGALFAAASQVVYSTTNDDDWKQRRNQSAIAGILTPVLITLAAFFIDTLFNINFYCLIGI
jgi:hypothetical protein